MHNIIPNDNGWHFDESKHRIPIEKLFMELFINSREENRSEKKIAERFNRGSNGLKKLLSILSSFQQLQVAN